MSDYDRVATAIDFIAANADAQPGLAEIAARANLSPHHFQRVFARWAGLTPKRFLQAVTVERAKRLLGEDELPLLATSESLGLSSSSRLQDHFVRLEALTPGEFRRQGDGVVIRYGSAESPFGRAFVAMTARGICALRFADGETDSQMLDTLRRSWPHGRFEPDAAGARRTLARVFSRNMEKAGPLSVCVSGTNFQVAVWRALLAIPPGRFASYGDIASAIGRPKAVRAVGTAIGANPCAFVIPCHRVIRSNGEIGGYRWGVTRKQAINLWEEAATDVILPECEDE